MAHRALNRSMEGKTATRSMRVSRSALRCKALNVTHQQQGPPPAWDKRVVVPEVQPRDTPKVSNVTLRCIITQLHRAGPAQLKPLRQQQRGCFSKDLNSAASPK